MLQMNDHHFEGYERKVYSHFRSSLFAFRQKDVDGLKYYGAEFNDAAAAQLSQAIANESEERKAKNAAVKARRQLTAAHALACYRCFLPDLAGFTRLRCAGPAPDLPI